MEQCGDDAGGAGGVCDCAGRAKKLDWKIEAEDYRRWIEAPVSIVERVDG